MIVFRKARSARQTKNDLDAYLTLNGGELTRWLAREVQSWGEFSYAELENLIMSGGLNDLIDWQSRWAEVVNETFTPAWLAAISAAAKKATKGKIILDDSDIDVKNWLKTRGGELITVLSEESKKAVAMVILRGQAEKVLPKKIAQQIRPLIGLNERQAQANMTYRQRVYQNLLASGLPPVTAEARAAKAALRYAGKQHRERADMIVNTELAFAYNRGADIGIKRAIKDGFMGRCEMVWTTAGTNRVCQRCLALKDKVVGHTDEDGVTLPPLHPRCRCAIMYREVSEKNNSAANGKEKPTSNKPRGLAAGNKIYFNEGGKSPYLIGAIDAKEPVVIKQVLEWAESSIVTAPIENAIIITRTGDIYHCTGGLNTLDSIVELGDKLNGAIVTHNHPVGSVNEYTFSKSDRELFNNFNLARLRGVDEYFTYELNRDVTFLDSEEEIPLIMDGYSEHIRNIQLARFSKYGYRRWLR